jgi:TolA-binding protein
MDARQVEMQARLDSLQEEVEENEGLLRGLQAQTGTRTEGLVERLSNLTAEMETMVRRMQTSPTPASGDSSPQAGVIFDEAFLQYQQGSYATAAAGFAEVLGRYPGSPRVSDALYYMGLCHEAMGEHHRAVEELMALWITMPGSERAPAALSRAARIYAEHGADADAERVRGILLEHYPDSEEALLLQDRGL